MIPEDGSGMVILYVDVHRRFQETMYLTEFGGNESFRKSKCDRMIILFGHDKYIFNKDTYTSRCWSGCDGEHPLIPKSEVMGLMVSAIQYREFRFGF